MSVRHFYLPLDLAPEWGQVLGFGMDNRQLAWVQPGNWWQIIVTAYAGILTVNGVPMPFSPGAVLIVPPSSRCMLERLDQQDITHNWIKFRPHPAGQVQMALPQVSQLGDYYSYFRSQLIIGVEFMPMCRARVDVAAWQLLWTVAKNPAVATEDPLVGELEQYIKENISATLSVAGLAELAGVSQSKLNRLFRDQFNQSPLEYIRTIRMQLACGLLIKTSKPIKEVALLCGYSDLQRFNKVVREVLGSSPRQIRNDRPEIRFIQDTQTEGSQALAALLSEAPRNF